MLDTLTRTGPPMPERRESEGVPEAPAASIDAESSINLILRARQGDDLAREALFSRYLKRLQRWAHGRLPAYARGPGDTLDLVQDTLLQVLRHLDTFEPRHAGAFLAYARSTLKNKITDRIRQAGRRPAGNPLDSTHPSPEPLQDEQFVATQLLERYEAGLERLKPEYREAIVARVELRLPWPEVAEALNKPSVPAAQMAVRRALVRLAREMAEHRRG